MGQVNLSLGQYLFKRVAELGVQHIIGVPGDFNLTLLDELYKVPELCWVGTCNELNAAYAADGYARIKGVPTALVTTYAVGELSAMNGVAGAYAEQAGMIHIVGMPSRAVQRARLMIHHTMEPGMDQRIYVGMSEPIRKTYTVLDDEETMAQEIDRVIEAAVRSRLPVFIYVPTDTVGILLPASRLSNPLDVRVKSYDLEAEDRIVKRILEVMDIPTSPVILVDVLSIRHGAQDLARRLVDLTRFPAYSTPLSKGVIDETSPCYHGVYNGQVSSAGCAEAVEGSDLVINLGPLLSDSNTGGFSRHIPNHKLVMLAHDYCQIFDERFEGVHFVPVLKRILEEIEKQPNSYKVKRAHVRDHSVGKSPDLATSGPIMQSYIWQRIGRFLSPNDILVVEAGTAQFGMPDAIFPANVSYITQSFWSSIGYSVGACLGACIASKEMKTPRRVILIVGEGSLQMTVQEVGSYIRFGFTPILFIINNGGYSIERAINGPEQEYNDISMLWDHQHLLETLGARKETGIKQRSFSCHKVEEVESVLDDKEFARADCIQLCEIFMDPFDYPWRLTAQIEITKMKQKAMLSARIIE